MNTLLSMEVRVFLYKLNDKTEKNTKQDAMLS